MDHAAFNNASRFELREYMISKWLVKVCPMLNDCNTLNK